MRGRPRKEDIIISTGACTSNFMQAYIDACKIIKSQEEEEDEYDYDYDYDYEYDNGK